MGRARLAKLSPPRPSQWLAREQLHLRLDELCRATPGWVTGGPGSGKTTLAATWAMARDRRMLWYRVDAGDADPAAVFAYLAELARSVRPKLRLPTFAADDDARLAAFARVFFRAFYAAMPASATLVIDDAHAAGPALDPLLAALMREVPDDVAVLILSRHAPEGILLDEVARGGVRVLEPEALAFSADEAAQLLEGRVAETNARALCRQADGWVAGILLLAQADRVPVHAGAPRHEGLESFFADRVVAQLEPAEQRMLAAASLLPDVEHAVLQRMGFGAEATTTLERLRAQHLFVTRLERAPASWRLHDLLRSAFRSRFDTFGDPAWRQATRRVACAVAAERGLIREAVQLHLDLGEADRALALAEAHARALVRAHRGGELEAVVASLGEAAASSLALQFARGELSWHRNDAHAAVAHLGAAYGLCAESAPAPTALLIGVTALGAILAGWQDFDGAKEWAQRVGLHLHAYAGLADPADRLRADSICLQAIDMMWGEPLGDRAELFQRLLGLIGADNADAAALPPDDVVVASGVLIECATYLLGDEALFGEVVQASLPWLRRAELSPVVEAGWLSIYAQSARRWPAQAAVSLPPPLSCLERAQVLGLDYGARGVAYAAAYFLAGVAVATNDLPALRARAKALREIADESQSSQLTGLLSIEAQLQALSGHWAAARRITLRNLDILERAGTPASERWGTEIVLHRIDIACGRAARARRSLQALAERCPPGIRRDFPNLLAEVAAAAEQWETAGRIDAERVRAIIERAAALAVPGFSLLLAPLTARLCAEALRLGVEPEFVRELIGSRHLSAPAPHEPHWPWPVRIHALGGLRIEVNGEPWLTGPRAQRKLIELVKALVAYGPAPADTAVVLDALWPDAEGGAARAAFDMAVMRLRKVLGDEHALRVEAGRIGFDAGRVWVDAFAYAAGALDVYPGPLFGADPVEPWWAAARERLHQRYLRRTQQQGQALESAGDLDAAAEAYEAGLAHDPLAEELYQGLIRCRLAQGRAADAMRVFRRCREQLSIILGVAPSATTQALMAPLARH